MEFYDPAEGFLQETMLVDQSWEPPFLLPTEPQTTTNGEGNHLFLGDGYYSHDNPPAHFPDSSFAGFYSPSCSELLLFQPRNFDFDCCLPVAEPGFPTADKFENLLLMGVEGGGNVGPAVLSPKVPAIDPGRKSWAVSRKKKTEGQPSKNLMAERRRRKRLNDRLSLLRSIVPKISKMDRTSILGDTIDYVKELLGRIDRLEQENGKRMMDNVFELLKEAKPNEALVRNSPKFHVERRNEDTVIEICCGGKPGLLLSTMSTLEALGLEVEQCVISCFNDFVMQASCSEVIWDKKIPVDSEDVIKQALFRSAGYGGKCM